LLVEVSRELHITKLQHQHHNRRFSHFHQNEKEREKERGCFVDQEGSCRFYAKLQRQGGLKTKNPHNMDLYEHARHWRLLRLVAASAAV
jgi:hypothetical protein